VSLISSTAILPKGKESLIKPDEGEEIFKIWYDEAVPFRRCNRPQSTYSEKEWQTAKAPRQLVSLKFEQDLRNFLCSRGVLR
jgi:hypothetical protein